MNDDGSAGKRAQFKKDKTSSKIARFFGIRQKEVTEEEILEIVDDAEQSGSIDEGTRDLIENVFDFADTTAKDIMTHRTEMTAVEDNESLSTLVSLAIESGRSRIPVFHEDTANIIGAIYVKDLLKYVCFDTPPDLDIKEIIRPVLYVPSSKVCSELFREMTSKKIQIAIVIDEYGGTEGLITMEDLVETIVGNIQDEYDDEEESVVQIDENRFTVDGATDLEDLEKILDVEFKDANSDTVAGLILDTLGGFPGEGEHPKITFDGISFTVEEIEDRRITKVLVEKN